jgi:hypothetical protein
MLNESPSALKRVITSLKVAALVTVLGTVVLAAERQLATEVSPQEIVVTDLAPARAASPASSAAAAPAAGEQASADYLPALIPEPRGEPAQVPPTF